MSGAGFTTNPSSAQTTPSTRSATPSPARVASVGAAIVRGRHRDPDPPVPKPAEQPSEVRQGMGQGQRVRRVPGGLDGRGGRGRSAPGLADHREGQVAETGHRHRRDRSAGGRPAGRRVVAQGPIERHLDRPTGRRGQAIGELGRPARPHRVEVDERAVLVEDDEPETRRRGRRSGDRRLVVTVAATGSIEPVIRETPASVRSGRADARAPAWTCRTSRRSKG